MRMFASFGTRFQVIKSVISLCLILILAACQSTDSLPDGLSNGEAGLEAAQFGDGSFQVLAYFPRGTSEQERRYRDIVRGARLALQELRSDDVRLIVERPNASPSAQSAFLQSLNGNKPGLIFGPSNPTDAQALASVDPQNRPPMLAFAASAMPPNRSAWSLYAGVASEVAAAAEVVVGAGHKTFLIVHPSGLSDSVLTGVEQSLQRTGGEVVARVPYASSSLVRDLQRRKGVFQRATAAVVLGGGAEAGRVIESLADQSFAATLKSLIATRSLPQEQYSRPYAQGLLIAQPAKSGSTTLSEKYRATYGVPITWDASIGFDAMAITIGILRARGPEAVNAETLQASRGFRGSTGLFRLRSDGRIERRYAVYQIQDGALAELRPGGDGF